MNKMNIMIAVIAGIVIIGGAAFAINNTNDKDNNTSEAMEKEDEVMEKKDDDSMEKEEAMEKEDDEAMEKEDGDAMEKEDDAMEKDDDSAMEKNGSFITLADYQSNKSKYEDKNPVYFFHASWCSICKGVEKELNADPALIPAGSTIIKVDYDSETELRQKYGVTTQYTFVQVDASDKQISKWSATSASQAIEGITL